jgi:hypothetical protein
VLQQVKVPYNGRCAVAGSRPNRRRFLVRFPAIRRRAKIALNDWVNGPHSLDGAWEWHGKTPEPSGPILMPRGFYLSLGGSQVEVLTFPPPPAATPPEA